MKTRLLLATALFCSGLAQAQTQKGNGILGGGIRLGYTLQKGESYKDPVISPRVNLQFGKFVADNWMLGIKLGLSGQYSRSVFIPNRSVFRWGNETRPSVNPFFRRYWSVGPVLFFAGAGIQMDYGRIFSKTANNSTREISTYKSANSSLNATVEAGGTYFLSNRLALQGAISGIGLPIPASSIGLGLVYWTGPNGSGKENTESALTPTQAGNWVIEGGFSGNKSRQVTIVPTRYTETTTNNLSINASIGRFIADNLLLGVGLGFSSQKSELPSPFGPNQTYSVSPFLQKYLTNRRLTPYVRGSVLYSNSGATGADDRINSIQGVLALGLAYRISNRFLAETSLGNVSYQLLQFNTDNKLHAVNLSAQLGSGFSLRYVIAGQK